MATRYVRATGVVTRRIGGETVLVPVRRGPSERSSEGLRTLFFLLNGTGEILWEQLSSPQLEDELARRLITEYEVAPQQAQEDVAVFLRDLRDAHALEVLEE
jgi:hypothetical protein